MNGLCTKVRKAGINCWDRDISRYVNSDDVASFHPFSEYMDGLPEWDGTDRVGPLARRVSELPLWVKYFHRWMLALTAQWMGMDSLRGNSVAPVLVSPRQGKKKSTFCKMLLPEPLRMYYTDSFDINAVSGAEQKLAAFGLINIDELDKFSANKMILLKNIMQMSGLNVRKAYKKNYSALPRIASFIATSNQKELLTDPSGSRRFLCVEVKKKIDDSPLEYGQLYAQLKAELADGMVYWFNSEEEEEIQLNNAPFRKQGMEEDLFRICYRLPQTGEEAPLLSAAQIYSCLKKRHPAAMRSSNPTQFGKVLSSLGIQREHTEYGNRYRLIEVA
jgi:predicted P-loop ATPase